MIAIIILQWRVNVMFDRIEKMKLLGTQPDDRVIITLDDERYHRPECPRIRGERKIVFQRTVSNLFVSPCPYCFMGAEEKNKPKTDYLYDR